MFGEMVAKRIEVTQEGSMEVYRRLLESPPVGLPVPFREPRRELYSSDGMSVVVVVRSNGRLEGIEEAVRLVGGLGLLVRGVEGEILIKPNCNTDDPFPRDTHPDTVRAIAEGLIASGFPSKRIVLGEISGRARGLPTRQTLTNLGMKRVVDDLGIKMVCFDEDEWVTVRPPRGTAWPNGIKIPRSVYEAERVVLAPIMRPHSTATFTMSLKLAVGMIDSAGREWLHDGKAHHRKLVELNLAYSADLVFADATEIITGYDPPRAAEPGIIVAGGNRVATDAVCVALMKHYGAERVLNRPVLGHEQLVIGEELGLGSPRLDKIDLRKSDLTGSEGFEDLISTIEEELKDDRRC
jgi:uncharacterized protein (DUF362 family)